MDLLNQFAMHAPSEIPAWFDAENGLFEFSYPVFTATEPQPPSHLSAEDFTELDAWLKDPCYDLGGVLKPIAAEWEGFWHAEVDYKDSKKLAYITTRYFEWRFYYARMMINQSVNGLGFGVITMKTLGELQAAKDELDELKAAQP